MKKLYFIANLIAGRATIADKLGEIIDEFNKADYEVTVHVTQSGDDATECAKYACDNGYDLLVCAGGDGTLNRCIHGVMTGERRIPIGYIPAGSTNDFARSLGIPKNTMDAVRWITHGEPKPIDIGSFNDKFFTYIVAFGAFTAISYETPQQIKNVLGHVSYFLNGLTQLNSLRAKKMRIEYGENVLEGDFIFGMVSNTGSIAGLLSMNDFLLDDGLFEVILIKKPANIVQLQRIVHSLLNISEDIDREYIRFFRTNKISFHALNDEQINWTLDGEFGGDAPLNVVENVSCAVSFMVGDRAESIFADPLGEDEEQ